MKYSLISFFKEFLAIYIVRKSRLEAKPRATILTNAGKIGWVMDSIFLTDTVCQY